MRSSGTKRAWCNRCSRGSARNAARSMRCVAVSIRRASGRVRAKRPGITRPSGICCKTRPSKAKRRLAKPGGRQWARASCAPRPASPLASWLLRQRGPQDQWSTIPVPALVEAAVFEAVQAQLDEHRRRARIPEKGSRYLLQGLLVCCQCGYAYCGRTNDARNAYYRCAGARNIPRRASRACVG